VPPKGFLVLQYAGDWKLAWKNTRKKLRELAGAFLGFTKLYPPKGTGINTCSTKQNLFN